MDIPITAVKKNTKTSVFAIQNGPYKSPFPSIFEVRKSGFNGSRAARIRIETSDESTLKYFE
jgi:hypothetical protein